jgi:exodeoxyribonuclease V alpha subunit
MNNIDSKILQEEKHFEDLCESTLTPGPFSQSVLEVIRKIVECCLTKKFLEVFQRDDDYSFELFRNEVLPKARSGLLGNESLIIASFHSAIDVFGHESMDESASQTLLYHFYPKISRVRNFASREWGLSLFKDLERKMPPLATQDQLFYSLIAQQLDRQEPLGWKQEEANLYYIIKETPFFVNGKVYYELVLDRGFSRERRTDCFVAFTSTYLPLKYAHYFTFVDNVSFFRGHKMPFKTVSTVGVHIRAIEWRRLGTVLGAAVPNGITKNLEYKNLMAILQNQPESLAQIIQWSDKEFSQFIREANLSSCETHYLLDLLTKCRAMIESKLPGSNLLLLFLHTMNNRLLRDQIAWKMESYDKWSPSPNPEASNLCVKNKSLPFDRAPYASYPSEHPISQDLLYDIIDPKNREFEFLDHYIEGQTDDCGLLYVPVDQIPAYHQIDAEIVNCNQLFSDSKQAHRSLVRLDGYVFIKGCEDTTKDIVEELKRYASVSNPRFADHISQQYQQHPEFNSQFYSSDKKEIAKNLFSRSNVAFINGAAGTGKTTFIGLITTLLSHFNPIILAKTNAAVDNLRDKVSRLSNSIFTLDTFFKKKETISTQFCIIDECSTISNSEMLDLLKHFRWKPIFLLLVGDEHQIESIHFGNWFSLCEKIFPNCCHELNTIFRAKNKKELQKLWAACREPLGAKDILTLLGHGDYTRTIEEFDFKKSSGDGVVLCLNYDGLYGINNINRIMQANNPGKIVTFRDSEFREGDPIIFSESRRLSPYIHNGMHALINKVNKQGGIVTFEITVLSPMVIPFGDTGTLGFKYIKQDVSGHQVITLSAKESWDQEGDIDDRSPSFLPFEVAYAVSIHKAQGLEYSDVRIIVTDNIAEKITPNIFYTAITRTTDRLHIYWSQASALAITNRLLDWKDKNQDLKIFRSRFPQLFS